MMYAVYWLKNYDNDRNKHLIYAPNSGDDGYYITEGNLEKGINMAGRLTITVPPTNPVWRDPTTGITNPSQFLDQADIITVEVIENNTAKEIWRGSVKGQSWDIYKNMTITCEGTLSFLNDILLPEYNFYWSGVVSHAYDPDEGLSSVNLDKLKDLIWPGKIMDGLDDLKDGMANAFDNMFGFNKNKPSIDDVGTTLDNSLSDAEDNVDRRCTVYDFIVWVMLIYNTALSIHPIDQRKQFKIGYIDPIFKQDKYKINQKTTQYTIAWEAIQSAVLDVFGGIMFASNWHEDEDGKIVYDDTNSYLYYYKDPIGTNTQLIQYGENLLNYSYEIDNTERVSRWYIFGKTKDADDKEIVVDMSSVNNGLKYVGFEEGVLFGTICRVEYTDLTTPLELYNYGMEKLRKSIMNAYTITVDAVDLHILDDTIDAFEPGKTARLVISNDMYTEHIDDLLLESVDIDLLNPANTTFTFTKIGGDVSD